MPRPLTVTAHGGLHISQRDTLRRGRAEANSSRNIVIAEFTDEGIDGPSTQIVVCCGGQLRSRRDVVAQVEQHVEVFHATTAVLQAVHGALDPARAFATWRALATGLAREELARCARSRAPCNWSGQRRPPSPSPASSPFRRPRLGRSAGPAGPARTTAPKRRRE